MILLKPVIAYVIREEMLMLSKYGGNHDKSNKVVYVQSNDSDQTGHPPSLIRVVAVHLKASLESKLPL